MSDFNSSLPIRTENDGDLVIKVADATLPSQQLAISAAGEASVEVTQPLPAGDNNIGNVDVVSLPADIDIRDLDAAQDSVQIKDAGGDALAISAAGAASVSVVDALPAGDNNIGNVDVLSLPADIDIRDLAFATDKVDVSGSDITATVDATDLDIRDLSHSQDSVKIGDGTDFLAIDAAGKIGAVIEDGGNSITVDAIDLDIRDLAFATDKVDVSGSDITATVSATDLDIRDLSHAQDSIKIGDGTDFLAISAAGAASVSVVDALPAGDNNIGNVDVVSLPAAYDEDSAHTSGDKGIQILAVRNDTAGSLVSANGDYSPLQVNSSGSLRATLPSIGTSGSATPANANLMGASDGVNLQPLNINASGNLRTTLPSIATNGAAAPSTSVLMGGKDDSSNLQPLKVNSSGELVLAGSFAEDSGHVSGDKGIQIFAVRKDTAGSLVDADGDYSPLQLSSSGSLRVTAPFNTTPGSAVPSNAAYIAGSDAGTLRGIKVDANGELQVDVLTQPARSHSTDSIKIGDGTDFLAVNADGSINVLMQESVQGDDIVNYDTTAAVAAAASDNHDYTVSVGKTLLLKQILISGSGKLKAEIQIETAAASNVFNTIAVMFNSSAAPNMELCPVQNIQVGAGVRVRVIRTNKDNQSQDVYSTILGVEI